MSGRTAAALCLVAFFATATVESRWEWMTSVWNALAAAVEEPAPPPDDEPETEPGGDGGWLIDPNG